MNLKKQARRLRQLAERARQTGDNSNGAPGYLESKARMFEQQARGQ